MKFASLQYLYLVWILPAMAILAVYSFRQKDQLLRRFADPALWDRLLPRRHRRRQVFKFLLLLAGVALLLVALLRPRWGFQWEEIRRKGVDILVAVDVSESMLAEDIKPNRLERAKRELQDLVSMLQGDRIGLIAFAGASFLECPLTLDYGAFRMFVGHLDTDLIPVPGTAIGEAIETAIKSFVPGKHTSRALILITDGEDHLGEPEKAAEDAKAKGIRIFTIGIGSAEGAPIPLQDGSGGFKKDRQGQMVLSRLQETTLQKIALATGGSYVRSVSGDLDLQKIYAEEIRGKMEAQELGSTQRRRWEERFQWFLFGGILLVLLEMYLAERRDRPSNTGRIRLPGGAALGAGLLLLTLGLCLAGPRPAGAESVHGKIRKGESAYDEEKYDAALESFVDAQVERPDDVLLKYDIGNTHYRMRNYREAEEAYGGVAAADDPTLRERALYNLGNCAYRQGKLKEAVAHYQQALDLDPTDEDARHNLEFVREEIKRRLNEAKKREEQQQQEQQQGQTCPNPKPQPEPGSDQTAKPSPAQQPETRPEQGKEQAQRQEEQQPDTQPAQGKEQPQPQEEQAAEPGGEQKQAGGESTPMAAQAQQMTPEEAQRWLNTLDEDSKEVARKQVERALRGSRRRPGKDW